MPGRERMMGVATVAVLSASLWGVNLIWLHRDTRPPVWDMALHQTYALNYLPSAAGAATPLPLASRSGNYPPFVHLVIAFCYLLFHPGPHIAVLANVPATLLLFASIYVLGASLAGHAAARWACLLTALTPYLVWMSRETVLDYWLSAWVAAALVALLRAREFRSHSGSLVFGVICGFGMLTKWLFAGFLAVPILYVCIRSRIARDRERLVHFADAMLAAATVCSVWYLPNLRNLVSYFFWNAQIGAHEGEPPVLSFQSLIYYLRLLEGYQLFAILFVVLGMAVFVVWRRHLLGDGWFLVAAIAGGWAAMTLLRTKDPRFTMPLLGPLMIVAGAWLASFQRTWKAGTVKAALVALLCVQVYAANFGLRALPREVVLLRGYTGSLRWDWNLYLQDYFHILGAPKREDWQQEAILRRIREDARIRGVEPAVDLIPDLAFFNSANFTLIARLRGWPMSIEHIQGDDDRVFEGTKYLIMTEGDQGMPWSTVSSRALNRRVVDDPQTYQLVALYTLPDGNGARLYFVNHGAGEKLGP